MAGRPKIYDEQQVIDKAIEVFRDKCYDAASTDELLSAMGIGKGSFYLNFKNGKEELYERSIRRFAEGLNERIKAEMEQSDDPVGYIKDLFYQMIKASPRQKNRGCYYGNTLVQLSDEHKSSKALAARLLKDLRQIFLHAINDAQKKGQIARSKDADALAWHLLNFWNGIHITRRMEKSPAILKQLVDLNFSLLQ
jgi:TetR/AcrR family transcriptional regulator, transcriptional repressor for nem operon